MKNYHLEIGKENLLLFQDKWSEVALKLLHLCQVLYKSAQSHRPLCHRKLWQTLCRKQAVYLILLLLSRRKCNAVISLIPMGIDVRWLWSRQSSVIVLKVPKKDSGSTASPVQLVVREDRGTPGQAPYVRTRILEYVRSDSQLTPGVPATLAGRMEPGRSCCVRDLQIPGSF